MFASGAGVWEQDAGPIWQICLDCEQGAVHKNGGQWWVHVRTVMTSFSLSHFSRYCSCSLSCQVMHKLHFCKIPMLIQCHRNDSDMKISRSKQVQWKNWILILSAWSGDNWNSRCSHRATKALVWVNHDQPLPEFQKGGCLDMEKVCDFATSKAAKNCSSVLWLGWRHVRAHAPPSVFYFSIRWTVELHDSIEASRDRSECRGELFLGNSTRLKDWWC